MCCVREPSASRGAQDYNHSKRLEHGIKSLVHDSKTISVTDPQSYAQRFITFIRSVFA